jgi:hypothetical protein
MRIFPYFSNSFHMLLPYGGKCGECVRRISSLEGGLPLEDYYGEMPAAWVPQPPAPRRRGSRWLLIGGVALVLALVLGVGAIVGSALGSSPASAASSQTGSASQASQPQAGGFRGFAPGGDNSAQGLAATPGPGGQGPCITVTVTSVSGSTITGTESNGTTLTIHTTSSTQYRQNGQSVSASAVKVGSKISVMGTTNSDGSITATSIDILG